MKQSIGCASIAGNVRAWNWHLAKLITCFTSAKLSFTKVSPFGRFFFARLSSEQVIYLWRVAFLRAIKQPCSFPYNWGNLVSYADLHLKGPVDVNPNWFSWNLKIFLLFTYDCYNFAEFSSRFWTFSLPSYWAASVLPIYQAAVVETTTTRSWPRPSSGSDASGDGSKRGSFGDASGSGTKLSLGSDISLTTGEVIHLFFFILSFVQFYTEWFTFGMQN